MNLHSSFMKGATAHLGPPVARFGEVSMAVEEKKPSRKPPVLKDATLVLLAKRIEILSNKIEQLDKSSRELSESINHCNDNTTRIQIGAIVAIVAAAAAVILLRIFV